MLNKDDKCRCFVKLDELRDGQTVFIGHGFICHESGPVTVYGNGDKAYFHCEAGTHYFAGCAEDDDNDNDEGYCLNVYKNNPRGN